MALYAIGDVQGCFGALLRLLEKIRFEPGTDRLWFTGDLVNRGPDSLAVLRFVRETGAVTVLGNHDLHLLAIALGGAPVKSKDVLQAVLDAPDAGELIEWLRARPLLHHDVSLNTVLVHAGLLPQWGLPQARAVAGEVERVLRGADAGDFLSVLYGNLPARWDSALTGADRWRLVINAMTRLRLCADDGTIDFHYKGAPGGQRTDLVPWYQHPRRRSRGVRIVFGHWATLGYYQGDNVIGLDSGCVWGGALTAMRLDGPEGKVSVRCPVAARLA